MGATRTAGIRPLLVPSSVGGLGNVLIGIEFGKPCSGVPTQLFDVHAGMIRPLEPFPIDGLMTMEQSLPPFPKNLINQHVCS
jgi:hypothetical protein